MLLQRQMDIFETLIRTLMASLLSLVLVPASGQDHGARRHRRRHKASNG
jgi:hypothetical protein